MVGKKCLLLRRTQTRLSPPPCSGKLSIPVETVPNHNQNTNAARCLGGSSSSRRERSKCSCRYQATALKPARGAEVAYRGHSGWPERIIYNCPRSRRPENAKTEWSPVPGVDMRHHCSGRQKGVRNDNFEKPGASRY